MTNTNMWKLPIFVLLLTTLFTFTHCWGQETHKKIQLKDVKVLTLHQGQMTKGRRVNPVPQLNCIGGDAKFHSKLHPRVVQCTNQGWDGQDYQWECKADMSDNVRFGVIQVSCEGYDNPDDEYVLAGSCGLNYNLEFTEAGKNRQSHQSWYNHYNNHYDNHSYRGTWFSSFFEALSQLVTIFLIGGFFLFIFCAAAQSGTYNRRPGHGWFPSFTTGAGLGYMFGSRRGWGYNHYPYNCYPSNYGGFGGRSHTGWTRNGNNGGTSRQTSGFGGTSRR